MSKKIGIAILGLGTVGANVLKILQENEFERKYNIRFCVHFAYVRDLKKKRNVSLEGIKVTDDIEEITNSSLVDVCIECMGGSGTQKTYDIITRFIKKGKHIIMSSKKCLALYKNEIIELVEENNVLLRYDATVGGSIPICNVFQCLSGYDSVNRIYGIANATTNYVLTTMNNEGLNYKEALKKAYEEGYAENDSSEDVEGWDALYKMCILMKFGLGVDVDPRQIIPKGIESILNISDDKSKFKVKQIFCAERVADNKFKYYVGPVKVPKDEILGNVDWQNNIIFVEHRYGGVRAYYGAGAGGKETAAIMVEDLMNLVNKIGSLI